MSSIETAKVFRRTSDINSTNETHDYLPHANGSSEFILMTDHQTSKNRSRDELNLEDNDNQCELCFRNIFRKKTLYKRLPILQWLPRYNRQDAIGDLIAGITVGLTVIPQGLAYSGVAGLPTQEESVIELKRKLKALRKGPRKQSPNEENIKPTMLEDFAIEIVPMSQENGVMYSESIANGTLRRINFDDEEDQLYGRDYIGDTFGLYGAFMGCFVYVLLGTCKDSTVGSTAIASLLTYQVAKGVWQRAVLLTFLTGILELLMAAFRLGFLVDFVSGPVSAGFTSAVALIVSTSQVKNILGVKSEGASFLQRWISMINDIHNTNINDAILGCVCVIILIALKSVGTIKIGPNSQEDLKWYHKCVNKTLWFIGVMRNATLVITCALVSMHLESKGLHYFRLTGNVPEGLPTPALPPFSIEARPGNETLGIPEIKGESFLDMINNLGYGLIIVPMIALVENIAVCKAFAKGKSIDATQEMIAIGVANVANSFFQGYRGNGGLARSAVNNNSGVRTPLGNFYIGLVVMLALMYLTKYFYFIPLTVLGAIIISAVIFQLQYDVIKPMWRSKRSDLIPGFVAFIACLVMPLEIGILIAIGLNLLFILYHSARPKVSLETLETHEGQKFLKLTPDRCLIFPSVEFVRNLILKSGAKTHLPVVIDCTYIYGADFTAAKVISSMIEDFKTRNQKIIFFNLKPSVVQIFEGLNCQLVLCYNADALNEELKTFVETPIGVKLDISPEDNNSTASTVTLTKYHVNSI